MASESNTLRSVRSFVLRTGRMTTGQKLSLEKYWPLYGLELTGRRLDYAATFGRSAPVVLEIGFGMGQSLVEMAGAQPDYDFIGVEVHTPGVGKLLHDCIEQSVKNLRVFNADALAVLGTHITDNSLERVQIYFPDPWPKTKHHKRRLIQPGLVQQLRKKLRVGGILHLATDWEHYAEHMMEVLCSAPGYRNCAAEYCFSDKPEYRPTTKFERRGENLGHGVWDILFQRVN